MHELCPVIHFLAHSFSIWPNILKVGELSIDWASALCFARTVSGLRSIKPQVKLFVIFEIHSPGL